MNCYCHILIDLFHIIKPQNDVLKLSGEYYWSESN